MMTIRRQRRAARGAAIVVCASLICPANSWISNSQPHHVSNTKSHHFRSAADASSLRLNSPNPTTTRTRRRKHAREESKLQMASFTTTFKGSRKQKRSKDLTSNQSVELQRKELTNHDILTRQDELELGAKVVRANQLRASISALIQEKEDSMEQQLFQQLYSHQGKLSEDVLATLTENQVDLEELRHFSIDDEALFDPDGKPTYSGDELPLVNHYQNQQERGIVGPDDWDDALLTEEEIIVGLDLPGGRAELQRILLEGAYARDCFIRNNIRLVVNIAKRWARNSARYDSQDGSKLVAIYAGNAHRPSLDEAIQEGILGLARAADRYDPSRGLRFSTYATYWVTSFVRNCFQSATTGSFKVPSQLHLVKSKYKTLMKNYNDAGKEIPPEEDIAKELGVNVKRLRAALRFTERLLSIDAPLTGNIQKGSGAGGDFMGAPDSLVSDTLQCTETHPEEQVELSFLRQCLENAMASELSPHERDVIRLRLGLDDGVQRTIKEVVEVCGGSISVAEVRMAEKRAYKKLRAPCALSNYKLIAFVDFAGIDKSSMSRF